MTGRSTLPVHMSTTDLQNHTKFCLADLQYFIVRRTGFRFLEHFLT